VSIGYTTTANLGEQRVSPLGVAQLATVPTEVELSYVSLQMLFAYMVKRR